MTMCSSSTLMLSASSDSGATWGSADRCRRIAAASTTVAVARVAATSAARADTTADQQVGARFTCFPLISHKRQSTDACSQGVWHRHKDAPIWRSGWDTPAGSSRSPVSASEQQRLGSRARYFGPVRHARGHVACVRCHNLEFLHHCGVRPPSTATSRRHAVIGTDACVRVVQCDDQHGRRWHCAP